MSNDDDYTPFDEVNDMLIGDDSDHAPLKVAPMLVPNVIPEVPGTSSRTIHIDHNRKKVLNNSVSLYRIYSAKDNSLLYVGISSDVDVTLGQFNSTKEWYHEAGKIVINDGFKDRKAAFDLKRQIVQSENPRYNKRGK